MRKCGQLERQSTTTDMPSSTSTNHTKVRPLPQFFSLFAVTLNKLTMQCKIPLPVPLDLLIELICSHGLSMILCTGKSKYLSIIKWVSATAHTWNHQGCASSTSVYLPGRTKGPSLQHQLQKAATPTRFPDGKGCQWISSVFLEATEQQNFSTHQPHLAENQTFRWQWKQRCRLKPGWEWWNFY